MINYLKNQIRSIQSDISLQVYGVALALTHVWTYFYWDSNNFFLNSQSGINTEPICFPWFPNCDLFRSSISMDSWALVLYTYLFLGCITVIFFLNRKTLPLAFGFLGLATAVKFFLHMSNYNFMGNYHYMIYLVIVAYLFLPHKVEVIKHLIVGFYIAAGFLKINIDWLSGAAMIRSPYIGGDFLVASLFYVVLLELVLVFGLLHQNRWVRWATLVQFLGFHAFSWHIVGFFYPMVMFCLLSVFVCEEWKVVKTGKPQPDYLGHLFRGQTHRVTWVVIVVFVVLQLVPFLVVRDPSLSGAARLSSLNMFDSKTQCQALMVAKTAQGTAHIRRPMKNLGTRLKCDPLVFLNQAHQLCRQNAEKKEIEKLSLTLFSKRITQKKFIKVLDIHDVCSLKNPLWAEFLSGEAS